MKTCTGKDQAEVKHSFLEILAGSGLSQRQLPLMSIDTRVPGPAVWLTACAHGDEVGGVVVIQEVFNQIKGCLLKGSINAFPLMNPTGFEAGSRYIGYSSREDLNRSFPGDPCGSLGERIAHQIFGRIKEGQPDLVIDLHNDWKRSVPYVVLDPRSCDSCVSAYKISKKTGEKAGFYLIEDTDDNKGCLTSSLLSNGIPAVTFELGESFVVNEQFVGYGVQSVLNILMDFQMIAVLPQRMPFPLHPEFRRKQVLMYSDKPHCSQTGVIRFLVNPGDLVEKGQPVVRIYDVFGRLAETITARSRSIVLGTSDSSVAFPGMAPVAYGVF